MKDSADYIRIISAPDTEVRNAYVVRDFYLNGKPKMTGRTLTPTIQLKKQGIFVEYFPNGRRKLIESYNNGELTGETSHYYPNGKLYYISSFDKDRRLAIISEARDSTGIVTVTDGNGTLTLYDDNFKVVSDRGGVVKGLREGEWRGIFRDSVKYVCLLKKVKDPAARVIFPLAKFMNFPPLKSNRYLKVGLVNFINFWQ